MSHLAIVDIVRGVAALSVAFYHTRETLWIGTRAYLAQNPELSIAWLASMVTIPFLWGGIGVPVFFVLSGYVIHRRSARELVQSSNPAFSARQFLTRRFIRIYPTLIAALLLTAVLDTISRIVAPASDKLGDTSLMTFVWNAASLQGIFAPSFGSNGALWTLALEVQFYLLYPLALMIRSRIGANAMLGASALLTLAGYLLLETNSIQAFPSYYLSWWLGAYIADREAAVSRPIRGALVAGPACIALGCALTLPHYAFAAQLAWAVGFALLLPQIIAFGGKWNAGRLYRLLKPIGHASYSIYAVHVPIVVCFSAIWLNGARSPSIFIAYAGFGAMLVAAWLFYLVAERRFMRLLNRVR